MPIKPFVKISAIEGVGSVNVKVKDYSPDIAPKRKKKPYEGDGFVRLFEEKMEENHGKSKARI